MGKCHSLNFQTKSLEVPRVNHHRRMRNLFCSCFELSAIRFIVPFHLHTNEIRSFRQRVRRFETLSMIYMPYMCANVRAQTFCGFGAIAKKKLNEGGLEQVLNHIPLPTLVSLVSLVSLVYRTVAQMANNFCHTRGIPNIPHVHRTVDFFASETTPPIQPADETINTKRWSCRWLESQHKNSQFPCKKSHLFELLPVACNGSH